MNSRRTLLTVSLAGLLATAVTGPVAAQSPSAPATSPGVSIPVGPAVTVVGKDYTHDIPDEFRRSLRT